LRLIRAPSAPDRREALSPVPSTPGEETAPRASQLASESYLAAAPGVHAAALEVLTV
jgi:hypothetical protein